MLDRGGIGKDGFCAFGSEKVYLLQSFFRARWERRSMTGRRLWKRNHPARFLGSPKRGNVSLELLLMGEMASLNRPHHKIERYPLGCVRAEPRGNQ
jgi:hypothetical protein